jgi:hypothetical protein
MTPSNALRRKHLLTCGLPAYSTLRRKHLLTCGLPASNAHRRKHLLTCGMTPTGLILISALLTACRMA